MNGVLLCPADKARMCCVIEDLVQFIYSVQPGCKFHWLLDLYVLHPKGTPSGPNSAHLPSQVIAYGDLDAVRNLQPSVI